MKLKSVSGDSTVQVSEAAFGHKFNEALVHQVLTAHRNPHAKKGPGQARAGSSRSPIWVGGGKTFAAKPRDFAQKVNRKMYRGALRSVLSDLARTDRLVVAPELTLESPKTKLLVERLKSWALGDVLIIVEAADEKLAL